MHQFDELGEKIFFNLDINQMITENQQIKFSSNFIEIKMNKNLIDNHNILSNFFNTNQKKFYNKEDLSNLNYNFVKSKENNHLRNCTKEDFELFEINQNCILGIKIHYLKKKSSSICLIDDFMIKSKVEKFMKIFLSSFFNFGNNYNNIANTIDSDKNSYSMEILKFLQDTPIILSNYISEILSVDNIFIDSIHYCKCELAKDMDCEQNLNKKKNDKISNFISNNCENFVKHNLNITSNDFTKENEKKYDISNEDFGFFLSNANHCILEEYFVKFFSVKNNKRINNLDTDLINLFDVNHFVSHDEHKEKYINKIIAGTNNYLLGILLLIIVISVLYMGYLVIKSFIGKYLAAKKDYYKDEEEEQSEINLKGRTKLKEKNKELDSLY